MIRDAVVADAGRLAEIFVAAWHAGYRGVVPDQVIDSLDVGDWTATFNELLPSATFRTAVWCFDDGRPLGFTRFGPDPELQRPDAGYLASLYIDPAAAGRGIGRTLLQHAVAELTADGRTRQALWVFGGNHRARKLYALAGFDATGGRRTDPRWGAEQLHYARSIAGDQTATPKSLAIPVRPDA